LNAVFKKIGEEPILKSDILEEMHRSIVKSYLDTIILAELKKSNALSGYDFLEFVQKKFGFLISSGTIYTLLYSMERKGLIQGEWTIEGKRVYVLTDKGANAINIILKSKEEIQRFLGTLF
jgi:DNA-binding PadR family transcriptional regulator